MDAIDVAPLTYRQKKRIAFVRNHPNIKEPFKKDILKGSIRIGMSKAMVEASWGIPREINLVSARYHQKQMVYGNIASGSVKYVYFKNEIVTEIQSF